MRYLFAALLLLSAGPLSPGVGFAQPQLAGTWEAAQRADNDERLYIVLSDAGKAEIVVEYGLPTPGKQRARTTAYGRWTHRGRDLQITYADVTDRLRYVPREPLAAVGLNGTAPALKPIGKRSPKSRLGSEVLWKAPHAYRMKGGPPSQPPYAPDAGSEPVK